ncbi:MAG: YgiT-type zinc finger protein [Phycisphaerales bacterium]|nr:MAG: YgiT-type zinc finger protein [Phycisphaerales bacterium]
MKKNVRQSECVLRCEYCGYDAREDVIKAAFWMDYGLIAVEGIPARLCEGCGEQHFDERVTETIRALLTNSTEEPERKIRVPVYDFPQLESIGEHCQSRSIRADKDFQAILRCKYCESETVEELVKSAFWLDERLIAVENIPAQVCEECEAQFYDDETAEKIAALERLTAVLNGARRYVTASVFTIRDNRNAADKRSHSDPSDGGYGQ